MSGRDEIIGSSKRNLVLKTAGNVKILVGDKYYNLTFRDADEEQEDKNEEITSNFIIAENISNYKTGKIEYPGDGKVIFTLEGEIYYTDNNSYNSYTNSASLINTQNYKFDKPIQLLADMPMLVTSNNLIKNLNANFLNGKTESDFLLNSNNIKIKNLIIDSISSSDGTFYYKNGKFSHENNEMELSDKIVIGKWNKILSYREITLDSYVKWNNNLIKDFCKISGASINDAKNMFKVVNLVNGIDSFVWDNYTLDDLFKMNELSFYPINKNNSQWSDGKYSFLKYSVIDFDKDLSEYNSVFLIELDALDGIEVGNEYSLNLKGSIEGVYRDKLTVTGLATRVERFGDGGYISIAIKEKTPLAVYKNSSEPSIGIWDLAGEDKKIEYYYYESVNTTSKIELLDEYLGSKDRIIGDISGESVEGWEGKDVGDYGLIMKNNTYLINPYIANNFHIINNNDLDYTLPGENGSYKYTNFIINGKEGKIILGQNPSTNGLRVCVMPMYDTWIEFGADFDETPQKIYADAYCIYEFISWKNNEGTSFWYLLNGDYIIDK